MVPLLQKISDLYLLGWVAVLLLVDAVIITVWQTLDPFEVIKKNNTGDVSPFEVVDNGIIGLCKI